MAWVIKPGVGDQVSSVNVCHFSVSATCGPDPRALASGARVRRTSNVTPQTASCGWRNISNGRRLSDHPLARYRDRKSATDCRISNADARRCQHCIHVCVMPSTMLAMRSHSRSRCSGACYSATAPTSYRSHRCRNNDRITLTSPHRRPPPALY